MGDFEGSNEITNIEWPSGDENTVAIIDLGTKSCLLGIVSGFEYAKVPDNATWTPGESVTIQLDKQAGNRHCTGVTAQYEVTLTYQ